MTAYDFAKLALVPGSLGLFLVGLAVGFIALRSSKTARFGNFLLAVLIVGYWTMSMPMGAWLFGRLVSVGYSPVEDPSALVKVQAIVVLDGSTRRYNRDSEELAVADRGSAVRALEAIRLYRALKPSLVLVTGGAYTNTHARRMPEGDAIRELLLAAGIPAARVMIESASHNTRESAANVSALLRAQGIERIALVTSSVHMRRATQDFAAAGLQAVPAPAPLEMPGAFAWWPSIAALDRSREAWHEVIGLLRDLCR
jgi:uncharacterized SAM-binding protein YcdF (DUF218 family)